MSFLFKLNGVEQEKTTKIMTFANIIQGACGWFQFIACIMLGNIKAQIKGFVGSLSPTIERTYNPIIALYAIIGIYQTALGALITLALMGRLPMVEGRKRFWLGAVHYGLLAQFGLVCFVCLETSSQATVFAAINDTAISEFYKMNPGDPNYKYYESFVVYSRYLIAWAIMEFLLCLPIALANLYAIHTRHINYEALEFAQDKTETAVHPEAQYQGRPDQTGMPGQLYVGQQAGYAAQQGGLGGQPGGLSGRPLEVAMIPK